MPNPPVIRVLPETVANQIAAGEVVERPASVVKELVENALDAGATRIEVAIEQGGSKRIQVDDNGCGMDHENALAALERQATSKISTVDDITRIATFGFRGEAIPSIASVSRFTLTTRPAGADAATQLSILGGTLADDLQVGHPQGTSVSVCDLFYNVPARKKFLRAPATELARIRQTLSAIALANPAVALRLQSEGRDLFRLPLGDTLEDRIRVLLGEPIAEALLLIDHTVGALHIHGYLSKPDFVRGGTPEQYFFINRRPAVAPQMQYALREAWPVREHRPVAVIFLDLPPEEVDVNVHPAKREVRFRHGGCVTDALIAAFSLALGRQLTPPPASRLPAPPPPIGRPGAIAPCPYPPAAPAPLCPIGPLPTPQAPPARQQHLPLVPPTPPLQPAPLPTPHFGEVPPPEPAATPAHAATPWTWLRIADMLEQDYWLVITDRGIVTVDAKAALERILYERFAPAAATPASQPLLLPETLSIPPADAERVLRFLPELAACGFDLSPQGDATFLINALPLALAELPPKEIVAELAAELDRTGVKKGLDAWRREVVARAAAKAAAGAYHPKSKAAAEALLHQLAQCEAPYATPRGRPVMILTSFRELDRRFQRL